MVLILSQNLNQPAHPTKKGWKHHNFLRKATCFPGEYLNKYRHACLNFQSADSLPPALKVLLGWPIALTWWGTSSLGQNLPCNLLNVRNWVAWTCKVTYACGKMRWRQKYTCMAEMCQHVANNWFINIWKQQAQNMREWDSKMMRFNWACANYPWTFEWKNALRVRFMRVWWIKLSEMANAHWNGVESCMLGWVHIEMPLGGWWMCIGAGECILDCWVHTEIIKAHWGGK